jgi:hypothetical protein
MKFLNEQHKVLTLRKLKQIEEWRKLPFDLQGVLERQRKRERQAEEMEKREILKKIKKVENDTGDFPFTSVTEP